MLWNYISGFIYLIRTFPTLLVCSNPHQPFERQKPKNDIIKRNIQLAGTGDVLTPEERKRVEFILGKITSNARFWQIFTLRILNFPRESSSRQLREISRRSLKFLCALEFIFLLANCNRLR